MLESCTLVSGLLGTAFKLTIKQPVLIREAPTATQGIPTVLMAKAPRTVAQLAAVSSNVGSALADLADDLGVKTTDEEDESSSQR
eukprot:12882674-Ditylum_brightwellii.AAC.1